MKNSKTNQLKNTHFIFTMVMVLFGSSNIFAQQIDFSGNWIFNNQQSISGKLYSNGSPKEVKIIQNSAGFTITSATTTYKGLDTTMTESFGLEGKPFETLSSSGRKKIITLQRPQSDKQFTEITSTYSKTQSDKLDFKTTDFWTLTDSGLVLDRKAENFTNGETWESKATYSKE